jgi:hypothetical protein
MDSKDKECGNKEDLLAISWSGYGEGWFSLAWGFLVLPGY